MINKVVYATNCKDRGCGERMIKKFQGGKNGKRVVTSKYTQVAMTRIETLNNFLKDSPDDSFLQHALALEYVKLGNDKDARILFEAILSREAGYIGSYYHLAKLLERTGETDEAIRVYEKGMLACKEAGDNHSFNELQGAYEDLVY